MKTWQKDAIIDMNKEMYCIGCKEHMFQIKTRRLNPFEIIEESCFFLKLKQEDVISKKRKRNLCEARFMIGDLLCNDKYLNLSLANVGFILGGRDHTTILHGKKMIEDLIFSNEDFKEKLLNLHLHVYRTTQYFRH